MRDKIEQLEIKAQGGGLLGQAYVSSFGKTKSSHFQSSSTGAEHLTSLASSETVLPQDVSTLQQRLQKVQKKLNKRTHQNKE